MSEAKPVLITVHDSTGKVIGTVLARPKSALWRATGIPPWVHVSRTPMRAVIVGKGRSATLHVHLPKGEPPPKRMVPL